MHRKYDPVEKDERAAGVDRVPVYKDALLPDEVSTDAGNEVMLHKKVVVDEGRISGVDTDYIALIERFPLTSIQDNAHLAKALGIIRELLAREQRSKGMEDYLGALSDLVETYETEHFPAPAVSGVEALRYLIEENGLTQNDLVPLFGTASIVSEVLSGKRRLALSHIERLSGYFGLPADVFIDRIPVTTG